MNNARNPWILTGLSAALVAAPMLYILSFLSFLHRIPNNDYWWLFAAFFPNGSGPDILNGLFTRSNEHIVILTNVVRLVNFLLTQGDNRGLFVIDFLIMLGILFFVIRIAVARSGFKGREILFIAPLLSLFIFSPAPAHNWILSMSGSAWFLANLFLASSTYVFIKGVESASFKHMLLAAALALCGALTYTTGIFILMAFVVFLVPYSLMFKKGIRFTVLFLLLAVATYLLWFGTYKTPASHPKPATDLTQLIRYVWIYMGNLFAAKHHFGAYRGLYGMAATLLLLSWAGLLLYRGIFKRDVELYLRSGPWLIFTAYGLLNMCATAVARYGLGLETAFATRYANITTLFWVGLIMAWLVFIKYRAGPVAVTFISLKTKRAWYALACVVVIPLLMIPMYLKGVTSVDRFRNEYSRGQELAKLSLQLGLPDTEILKKIWRWDAKWLVDQVPNMKKIKHVPFDSLHIPVYEYDKPIDPARTIALPEGSVGSEFHTARRLDNDTIRIQGWACVKGREDPWDYILMVNSELKMRGGALAGYHDERARAFLRRNDENRAGWEGFARLEPLEKELVAYGRMKDGALVKLATITISD